MPYICPLAQAEPASKKTNKSHTRRLTDAVPAAVAKAIARMSNSTEYDNNNK